MDAVEYLKERARMTKNCDISCNECPLSFECTEYDVTCSVLEGKYPEEAVEIVQKWVEEHPVKTRAKDFLEKHPSAPLEDGYPVACAEFCGYGACEEKPPKSCQKCWNRPLEEEK